MPRDRPPAPASDDSAAARAARRIRALEEPLDVRLAAVEPYYLLEVRNPTHRTAYLVLLPEHPRPGVSLCTCTDFARRGLGTCKHIESALRWLDGHPEATPPPRAPSAVRSPDPWVEIERRLAERENERRLTWRSLARPGEALLAGAIPRTGGGNG